MHYDHFEVKVRPQDYVTWPRGGGFQPVQLLVNGSDLIDLVRRVELPFAKAEWDERIANGESEKELGERGSLAGRYLHLSKERALLPSTALMGEVYDHGFTVGPDHPSHEKSLLLQCTCGNIDCWFLLASIETTKKSVTWSDFCQFHRPWKYQLGPYVFDREKYIAELIPKT
jgi:hypothetical protein